MKRCGKCGLTKGLTEYHRDARERDLLRRTCKACVAISDKARNGRDPELHREQYKAWREANKAYYKIAKCFRRARDRAKQYSSLGVLTHEKVRQRIHVWGNRCWMCEQPAEAIDHVKPLSMGGSNWPCNIRPVCMSCNSQKGRQWPYP